MREFKKGDKVRILSTRSSGLPIRFLGRTVILTHTPDSVMCKFREETSYWNVLLDEIELVIEMNRNGANEVFSEGANE